MNHIDIYNIILNSGIQEKIAKSYAKQTGLSEIEAKDAIAEMFEKEINSVGKDLSSIKDTDIIQESQNKMSLDEFLKDKKVIKDK